VLLSQGPGLPAHASSAVKARLVGWPAAWPHMVLYCPVTWYQLRYAQYQIKETDAGGGMHGDSGWMVKKLNASSRRQPWAAAGLRLGGRRQCSLRPNGWLRLGNTPAELCSFCAPAPRVQSSVGSTSYFKGAVVASGSDAAEAWVSGGGAWMTGGLLTEGGCSRPGGDHASPALPVGPPHPNPHSYIHAVLLTYWRRPGQGGASLPCQPSPPCQPTHHPSPQHPQQFRHARAHAGSLNVRTDHAPPSQQRLLPLAPPRSVHH
jgi:hypothetical protein